MIQYNLVANDSMKTVSMVIHGDLKVITSEHPNFAPIVNELLKPDADESVVSDLLDIPTALNKTFEKITDRISINGDQVFLDNDPLDNSLFEALLEAHRSGNKADVESLAWFFENLLENPEEHSRKQLYNWIAKHGLSITEDGLLLAYKGVRSDLTSIHAGGAIVDGVHRDGHVPNEVGSTVEMARSEVQHNPSVACSTGLHAGTFDYAQSFKGPDGRILLVALNPRDIISVPNDSQSQKIRACRYDILEEVTSPVQEGLVPRRTARVEQERAEVEPQFSYDFYDPDYHCHCECY